MKRIAIYARVSTNNGTQDYQRQINDLTSLLQSNNYSKEQIEIFAESISGYKKKAERPELNRMLNIIEEDSKYFECIYVTEISRLGRNPSETRQTIDMLTDLNIPIYIHSLGRATLDKDGKRDSIMNIILQVLLEFANAESEQMKNRSKSGLLTSAKAGKAGGSKHLPYGYKKDENKMLTVDEEEAIIVREMFDLYQQGNGVKIISGILNSRNVPTRYNKAYAGQTIKFGIEKNADKIKWTDKTVLDIISNPLYKGQRRFKGEILDAPRIISDVLFDTCEKVRMSKTHRNNLTTYTYLLKDMIKCGCCGRNYYARYKPKEGGDKVYVCSSSLIKGERCQNKGINIMLLETAMFQELLIRDLIWHQVKNKYDIKKEHEKDINILTNQLKTELTALQNKKSEKERLLDGFLAGIIPQDIYTERDLKISTQLKNIEKKIGLIKNEISQKNIIIAKHSTDESNQRILEQAINNRVELKGIFRQLIDSVIINDLTTKLSLVTFYVKFNGNISKPISILIDKVSIRKKKLRFISLWQYDFETPIFENYIMSTNKQDVIDGLNDYIKPEHWKTEII